MLVFLKGSKNYCLSVKTIITFMASTVCFNKTCAHCSQLEKVGGGVKVVMTPINPCLVKTCWNSGCMNEYTVNNDGHLINTNVTGLLGVNAYVEAACKCGLTDYSKKLSCDPNPCKNQGICSPSDFSGFT